MSMCCNPETEAEEIVANGSSPGSSLRIDEQHVTGPVGIDVLAEEQRRSCDRGRWLAHQHTPAPPTSLIT
jgi:hypothetical protein